MAAFIWPTAAVHVTAGQSLYAGLAGHGRMFANWKWKEVEVAVAVAVAAAAVVAVAIAVAVAVAVAEGGSVGGRETPESD